MRKLASYPGALMNGTEYTVRPLEPESDLVALAGLLTAIRRAEGNETPATAEELRPALERARFRRWVMEEPGGEGMIGLAVLFAQTPERGYGDIRVHPAWRRRGVGRALSEALALGATETGVRYLAIDVAADNQQALRFLLSQGFRFRGDVWALSLPATAELPAPVWPDGYNVRTYAEINDRPLLVDVCNRVFGDLWGHWENTPGLVDEAHVAEWLPQFDPRGIFLVFDAAGEAVGQCRAQPAAPDAPPDTPHVLDQPGIAPEARAARLHMPLALTAAHWLHGQGARPIRLESWGDTAETIAAYQALGFALADHEVSYVRELGR